MIYEIHPLIMQDAQTLVQALVTSKLDNGNVLYFGIFKSLLHKLQLVQNATACPFLWSEKSMIRSQGTQSTTLASHPISY